MRSRDRVARSGAPGAAGDVPAGASGIDWYGADRTGYLCHGLVLARLTAPGIDATARVAPLR